MHPFISIIPHNWFLAGISSRKVLSWFRCVFRQWNNICLHSSSPDASAAMIVYLSHIEPNPQDIIRCAKAWNLRITLINHPPFVRLLPKTELIQWHFSFLSVLFIFPILLPRLNQYTFIFAPRDKASWRQTLSMKSFCVESALSFQVEAHPSILQNIIWFLCPNAVQILNSIPFCPLTSDSSPHGSCIVVV